MNELHLFAGAGGGILGGLLLGHRPCCAVEIEPYCRKVLLQRQRDGALPWFPIWDDVQTFDGKPWAGIADIVCGGFPCQDISAAGKGAGITGERSGLWVEMARIIREVRPKFAFVENSPMLVGRGLGRVLGDMAEMGFDARWGVVSGQDAAWLAGNPAVYHERERIWILAKSADANRREQRRQYKPGWEEDWRTAAGWVGEISDPARIQQGRQEQRAEWERVRKGCESEDADADSVHDDNRRHEQRNDAQLKENIGIGNWWQFEPRLGRVANGVANRVDRLKSIGNGQVPQVAALAWRILMDAFLSS